MFHCCFSVILYGVRVLTLESQFCIVVSHFTTMISPFTIVMLQCSTVV